MKELDDVMCDASTRNPQFKIRNIRPFWTLNFELPPTKQGLLLLLACDLSPLCLLGNLCREIEDLATIVPSAVHADSVGLVVSAAVSTLRNTSCREGVMRTTIIAM